MSDLFLGYFFENDAMACRRGFRGCGGDGGGGWSGSCRGAARMHAPQLQGAQDGFQLVEQGGEVGASGRRRGLDRLSDLLDYFGLL